jgi:hypothetical protein
LLLPIHAARDIEMLHTSLSVKNEGKRCIRQDELGFGRATAGVFTLRLLVLTCFVRTFPSHGKQDSHSSFSRMTMYANCPRHNVSCGIMAASIPLPNPLVFSIDFDLLPEASPTHWQTAFRHDPCRHLEPP